MSRRKTPARRWHIGDACRVPVEIRLSRSPMRTRIDWHRAVVTGLRGDRVIVSTRIGGFERVLPWWEVYPPLKPRGNCRWRTNWQGRKPLPSPLKSG